MSTNDLSRAKWGRRGIGNYMIRIGLPYLPYLPRDFLKFYDFLRRILFIITFYSSRVSREGRAMILNLVGYGCPTCPTCPTLEIH